LGLWNKSKSGGEKKEVRKREEDRRIKEKEMKIDRYFYFYSYFFLLLNSKRRSFFSLFVLKIFFPFFLVFWIQEEIPLFLFPFYCFVFPFLVSKE
jgi:hypothetical protein